MLSAKSQTVTDLHGKRALRYNFLQLTLFFESYFKAIKYLIINFIYSEVASVTVLFSYLYNCIILLNTGIQVVQK